MQIDALVDYGLCHVEVEVSDNASHCVFITFFHSAQVYIPIFELILGNGFRTPKMEIDVRKITVKKCLKSIVAAKSNEVRITLARQRYLTVVSKSDAFRVVPWARPDREDSHFFHQTRRSRKAEQRSGRICTDVRC